MVPIKESDLEGVKRAVDIDARTLNRIIDKLLSLYFKELDEEIIEVQNLIQENKGDIHISEVSYHIGLLPTIMYRAGSSLETIGLSQDMSEARRKESFQEAVLECDEKSATARNAYADSVTMSEKVVATMYQRAYKKAKVKLDTASEVLASLKRIQTWKLAEYERLENTSNINFRN